jgi:hypothetical protein
MRLSNGVDEHARTQICAAVFFMVSAVIIVAVLISSVSTEFEYHHHKLFGFGLAADLLYLIINIELTIYSVGSIWYYHYLENKQGEVCCLLCLIAVESIIALTLSIIALVYQVEIDTSEWHNYRPMYGVALGYVLVSGASAIGLCTLVCVSCLINRCISMFSGTDESQEEINESLFAASNNINTIVRRTSSSAMV